MSSSIACQLFILVVSMNAAADARPSVTFAEWTTLRRLFNETGGANGSWRNATGWNVSEYEAAPDPCDGRSWFGIYEWRDYGNAGLHVPTCAGNATAGAPRVQVLSLTADPAAANPRGNELRGGLGARQRRVQGHFAGLAVLVGVRARL